MSKKKINNFYSLKMRSLGHTIKKQLNCFIIMPFSEAKFMDTDGTEQTLNEKELEHIYKELFIKAVGSYDNNNVSFINIHRSNAKRGNFVKDIVGKLQNYDLVIADLTGLNPNVFYELGIRHTLRNGTIMITQNVKYLPSDLGNYIGAEYKYYKKAVEFDAYYPEFEKKLHSLIDDVLEDTSKVDNPVREFIGDRVIFRKEARIKEIEGNIELMEHLIKRYLLCMAGFYKNIYNISISDRDYMMESLTETSKPFLNRLVMQSGNLEAISFIEYINFSIKIIVTNLTKLHESGIKTDMPTIRRDYFLKLWDSKKEGYHLLDLKKFYKYNEATDKYDCIDKENEPMLKSFDFFIDEWKKELEELTQ